MVIVLLPGMASLGYPVLEKGKKNEEEKAVEMRGEKEKGGEKKSRVTGN